MQTMASKLVPTSRVVRVSSSFFFFSFLIHAFFSNASDPEIGSESTSSTPDSDDEKPETAFSFDRSSPEERNMPFDQSSHGTRIHSLRFVGPIRLSRVGGRKKNCVRYRVPRRRTLHIQWVALCCTATGKVGSVVTKARPKGSTTCLFGSRDLKSRSGRKQ